ncbi:MAG TPA: hypothetical protein VML55_17420 [Planctomycetaceae bacterium]|nr:hypothetical protein [Planctomycetaceae bacterium]
MHNSSGALQLASWQRWSLAAGAAGLIVCAGGGVLLPEQFYRSWLIAWVFWAWLSLGMLGLLLIQSLIWSNWGRAARPILVSGAEVLPLMAVLFLPVLLEPERLYEWARPDAVAHDHRLQHKQPWLNETAFRVRAGVYLVAWVGILLLVPRRLLPDHADAPGAPLETIPLRGPALALLMLTASFAAFDWMMSLEPLWYSSIYGAIFAIEGLLAGMAASVLIFVACRRETGFVEFATPQLFNDFGNLLLAFTILWGYVEFSQFLIIWAGNLPDEIVWYLKRSAGGWQVLIVVVAVLHLVVPFFLLLSRDVKRDPVRLAGVAGLLLVMRYVENYWTLAPAYGASGVPVHWLDAAALVGIGGVWLAAALFRLRASVKSVSSVPSVVYS